MLDWVCEQRDSIRKSAQEMDAKLIEVVREEQMLFKQDEAAINRKYPVLPFNPLTPATFTFVSLRRRLITDRQQQLKKGDGLDYCHAVMASVFSSVAALDKHWKRRIESLPKPNKLAKIYYQPELDRMVTDIEFYFRQSQTAA